MMDLVRIPTSDPDLYAAYESARDEANLALVSWHRAASPDRRARFSAYRAAIDREDAAALAWMQFRARSAR
jgi:hypothetical protein